MVIEVKTNHLDKSKPYLKNIVIDFQKFNTWKTQLTAAINFISSKDTDQESVMHSKTKE